MSCDYSYIGKGRILLGLRSGGILRFIGNVTALNFQTQTTKIELPDMTVAGGGNCDSVSRIQSVTGTLDARDLSPENIEIALRGLASDIAAGTVTDESQTAYDGGSVVLDNIPDPDATLTVTDDPMTETYVEGTDYIRTLSGIEPIAGGGIADEDPLLISYTKLAASSIEALVNSGEEYRMVFEGLNEAKSGRPVIIRTHRQKFDPAQDLSAIGDEFATLQMPFELLKDSSISAGGPTDPSQYFKVQMAKVA